LAGIEPSYDRIHRDSRRQVGGPLRPGTLWDLIAQMTMRDVHGRSAQLIHFGFELRFACRVLKQ
jgi:hypothetical protein